MLLEVVQESLAHFGGSPLRLFVRHGCGLRASEERCVCGKALCEGVRQRDGVSVGEAAAAGVCKSASSCLTQTGSSRECLVEHHRASCSGAAGYCR